MINREGEVTKRVEFTHPMSLLGGGAQMGRVARGSECAFPSIYTAIPPIFFCPTPVVMTTTICFRCFASGSP